MDGPDRTRHDEQLNVREPTAIRRYTNEYVRRLLLERYHIRAKLENPGGSVILTASALPDVERGGIEYSSEIGNSFHLDLIEVEDQMSDLPKGMQDEIVDWIDGMSSQQAAYYYSAKGGVTIRQRRRRAIERMVKELNGRQSTESEGVGRTRDGDTEARREEESDDPVQGRDSGQASATVDS